MDSKNPISNRELDKLIATRIMGLPTLVLNSDSLCPYCGEKMWIGISRSRCTTCNEWRYSPYKEYSERIEDMFEVEEKIFEDGNAVAYANHLNFVVMKKNNTRAVNDWLHYFVLAHAGARERAWAAVATYMEIKDAS